MALPRAVAMMMAASSGVAVRRLVALRTARRVAAGILQQGSVTGTGFVCQRRSIFNSAIFSPHRVRSASV